MHWELRDYKSFIDGNTAWMCTMTKGIERALKTICCALRTYLRSKSFDLDNFYVTFAWVESRGQIIKQLLTFVTIWANHALLLLLFKFDFISFAARHRKVVEKQQTYMKLDETTKEREKVNCVSFQRLKLYIMKY